MSWISQITVDTTATAKAGWCLSLAEDATGAPHLFPSARAAYDGATDKHADTDYPADAVVALFWDWTSKADGVDYGHIIINVPGQGFFSSPKNWGEVGNAWYTSIDEVSNWLSGATYLGWTSDLAGVTLSSWVPDAPPAPPAPNERTVAAAPANRRDAPSSQANLVDPVLDAGAVGTFAGWIHGEAVDGNDVWYQGVSGNWFWSGAFTSSSTDGLADLNPVAAPAAVAAPEPAPAVEVPAVEVAPVAPAIDPVAPVVAPVVTPVEAPPVPPAVEQIVTPVVTPTVTPTPVKEAPVIITPTPAELSTLNDQIAASNDPTEAGQFDLISLGFWDYAGERVIKTFAMTFGSLLTTMGAVVISSPTSADVFTQIGWTFISTSAALSALMSLAVALSSFKNIVTLPAKK